MTPANYSQRMVTDLPATTEAFHGCFPTRSPDVKYSPRRNTFAMATFKPEPRLVPHANPHASLFHHSCHPGCQLDFPFTSYLTTTPTCSQPFSLALWDLWQTKLPLIHCWRLFLCFPLGLKPVFSLLQLVFVPQKDMLKSQSPLF